MNREEKLDDGRANYCGFPPGSRLIAGEEGAGADSRPVPAVRGGKSEG